MVKNLETAKELLAHYKSLTLAYLQDEWLKFSEQFDSEILITGGDVIQGITGFGTTGSCSLCNACHVNCSNCIYSVLNDVEDGRNCLDITYHKVDCAITPEELYEAIQFRIDRLQKAIDLCTNSNIS